MKRTLCLLAPALLLLGCKDRTYLDPSYCGNNDGDNFCAQDSPERPFCVVGHAQCLEAAGIDRSTNGCAAAAPQDLECYAPCGIGNDDSCLDPTDPTASSSSTTDGETETEPTSTTDTSSSSSSSTTGPECMEDDECTDAAAPICIDEACVPCSAAVDVTPDEACAVFDEGAPLCVDDACVSCTAEDIGACADETPICDVEASSCVACRFHEDCQDLGLPACNIATGACFSSDAVSMVNAGTGGSIQGAIDGVADGATHAIVITGDGAEHGITVDGGKVIALVSDGTAVREVDGQEGNPTLTVTGTGTTVYLHRLELNGNTDDVGVSVESSATFYADSAQLVGNNGGGVQLAGGTTGFIRNSMIGGDAGNSAAITSSGELSILFSTLGRDTNFGDPVLECSGGTVEVRNSIIVNQTNTPGGEVNCAGISLDTTTAVESTTTPADWFGAGFASGTYFLNAAGQTQFSGTAEWQPGDPPFDFDGDPRPDPDNLPGADVP